MMMSDLHRRYLGALRRLQFASPEELVAHQLSFLQRLVQHAHENVPYYRERLAGVLKDGRFNRQAWFDVPLLSRAEIQANAKDFYATSVPPQVGEKIPGSTSGTSGSPLEFHQSHLATIASECQYERMLEVHSIDRAAHLAQIRVDRSAPYPHGREKEGWSLTCPTARQSKLDVRTPIAEQAEWLLARHPQYLATYPSNAAAVAQHIQAIGAKLPLSGVFTVGEHVTQQHRSVVRRIFGCRLFDNYGATETGYLAFECPAGAGYHIAFESLLIEVTNDKGETLPPGELGRVVITPLYNYAMPFLRYSIGDYAVAADGPCPCGRTLPRLANIAGRVRSVLTFADGSRRSGWGLRNSFQPLLLAREMQFVQTTLDRIEVRYVPGDRGNQPDARLIEETGRRVIHPTVAVRAIAVEQITRPPSGKTEECISLVTPPLH